MSIVGKDSEKKIWFKSDHYLTDITLAKEFRIICNFPKFFWLIPGSYSLVYKNDKGKYKHYNTANSYTMYTEIGIYPTRRRASMALEEIMQLKGIDEVI